MGRRNGGEVCGRKKENGEERRRKEGFKKRKIEKEKQNIICDVETE